MVKSKVQIIHLLELVNLVASHHVQKMSLLSYLQANNANQFISDFLPRNEQIH